MQLWRVSRHRKLDGEGGLWASGRWHSQGHAMYYCAKHQSTALLEWLVHLEVGSDDAPVTIPYIVLDVPDDLASKNISIEALPKGWQRDLETTRAIGDAWIAARDTPLLLVPSIIAPEVENILVNPLHSDASRITIARAFNHPFDPRLIKSEQG